MSRTPLLIIICSVGLISFLLISSTFPLKNPFFQTLYPKPISQAAPKRSHPPVETPQPSLAPTSTPIFTPLVSPTPTSFATPTNPPSGPSPTPLTDISQLDIPDDPAVRALLAQFFSSPPPNTSLSGPTPDPSQAARAGSPSNISQSSNSTFSDQLTFTRASDEPQDNVSFFQRFKNFFKGIYIWIDDFFTAQDGLSKKP